MYGERSISWLPRVCSRELLEPSATRREKSMDVKFTSTFASYKNFKVSEVNAHTI